MSTIPPTGPPGPPTPPPPGSPGSPGGWPQGPMSQGPPPPNSNLVWGILTTLFCCLPFGIVSIVFAAKVDGLYASGQYALAQDAADSAKKWAIVSAAVGVAVGVIVGVFYLILIVAAVNSPNLQ